MEPRILVVDYGAGNLRSVARALAHVGADPRVSSDPGALARADGVVLPGVGAAADTMDNLRRRGLIEPVRDYIAGGRPFLGVCMGLQALFDRSEEGGGQECLGILPGVVRHFNLTGLKVPHMGWNTVTWTRDHPVTRAIPGGRYFYFVHSFFPEPAVPELVLGQTTYGRPFASVVARENVVATQFHPEKSGHWGLELYRAFVDWVRASDGTRPGAGAAATTSGGHD